MKIMKRVLVLLLAAAMLYSMTGCMFFLNRVQKNQEVVEKQPLMESVVVEGGSVGDRCHTLDLPIYGEDAFANVEDFRGKVTIINFWYLYCGACVKDLQTEFPMIKEEYGDQVEILAVHAYEEYNCDIPDFIENSFPGADFTFCRDAENEAYFHMLGGRQSWPVTVILDQNGVIVRNITGSVTYEELKYIIDDMV